MCIIAQSYAPSKQPWCMMVDQQRTVLTPKLFIACYAAMLPQPHTLTCSAGIFPRQQYYASLTTTLAAGDEGVQLWKTKEHSSRLSIHGPLHLSPSDCSSPRPMTAWRTDRINELQKRLWGRNNIVEAGCHERLLYPKRLRFFTAHQCVPSWDILNKKLNK